MNVKNSILIPCYNGEIYIDRSFTSILNQKYENIEVIVVNDGSNDGSEEKILSYKTRFENRGYSFVYIKQQNKGAAAAINNALKVFTGEYFSLMDVDDYLMPDSISSMINFLEENKDYGLVRTNGFIVKIENIDKPLGLFVEHDYEKKVNNIFELLVKGLANNWPGGYMLRTKDFLNVNPNREIYETQFGQNLQILMPISYYYKAGFIDIPLMKYIKYNTSHSTAYNKERKIELYQGYKDIRINIIKSMDINQQYYLNIIEEKYQDIFLNIAYQFRDLTLAKEQIEKIKQNRNLNYKERILYFSVRYKIISNLLKVYNKFKLSLG